MVDIVMLGKRQPGIGPINRTRGGEHQMLHAAMPASLDNVAESNQIGVNIGLGISDRISHACLGRQMHYGVELLFLKKLRHCFPIDDIELLEFELAMVLYALEARFLQPDIVIVIHIIDAAPRIAPLQQPERERGTDKTGGPCDKY